jgi:hypothetical protein
MPNLVKAVLAMSLVIMALFAREDRQERKRETPNR